MKTSLKNIVLIAGILTLALVATGCKAPAPSAKHVVRLVGTGTRVGITQNPVTQAYELGIKRLQIDFITIPLIYSTNAQGVVTVVIPDLVHRYEVKASNSNFGNGGVTSTLSIGTNAVATELGGKSPPINRP